MIIEWLTFVSVVVVGLAAAAVRYITQRYSLHASHVIDEIKNWREHTNAITLHVRGHCDKCNSVFEMEVVDGAGAHNPAFSTASRYRMQELVNAQLQGRPRSVTSV